MPSVFATGSKLVNENTLRELASTKQPAMSSMDADDSGLTFAGGVIVRRHYNCHIGKWRNTPMSSLSVGWLRRWWGQSAV